MNICQENLYYTQELQKRLYNKHTKPSHYALGNKVWLNYKYIKTKQNWKLKAKFFGLFWLFYLGRNQTYKLEFLTK